MSLGRRLISTGGAAECFTDNVNPFTGTSADGGVLLYSLDYDASDTGDTSDGTPSNVTFGVGGQINYGARFNGSSSFINTNYTLTTDTTFSFSWWMNVEAPSSGNHYIVNDGNGTVHDGSFGIYHNASGQLGVFTDDNGGGAVQGGTLSISGGCSGSWMHFVVSVNDTTATIYKNGSSEGTITVGSHTTAGVLTLIIGRLGHYSANHLNGDLDQFRYFSKAISADEVSLLYAEAACVYTATTTDNDYPTTNTAYYELNATADDSHSGTYNGTESNITYELGRYGQAAVFNGSNSVITNSSLGTALNVSAFTFSLWFKTNVNDSTDRILISSFDGSGNARFYVSIVNSGLSVVIYGSSSTYIQNFTNTVAIGNWYHLAVTHTGTTTTVYLNRSSITPSSTSGSAVAIKIASSPQPLTFGQLQGNIGTYALNGSLDQVRIFTSALSSSQVTELYNEKPEVDTSNFKAVLYEGNSGHNYISNVGFQPDLTWVKFRNTAVRHMLTDSVRGTASQIFSNELFAAQNYLEFTSFDENGFTVDYNSGSQYFNTTGLDYVAWNWKGGGDAVNIGVNSITGSTPSIASDVSANTAAGFSIVKVNNHNNTQTIGHGLSQAPEVIFQKTTNSSSYGWYVYHKDVGNDKYLQLNTSAAAVSDNFWDYTTPTDTVFTHRFSTSSFNMIFYCWHSVAGYSKIGSYTGSTSGVTENIGFEPSMVIIKNTTQSDPWGIFDNKRPSGTGNRSYLYPSTADDEDVYGGSLSGVTLTSTGFAIDNTNSHMVNQNGETYLYMAFK